ncbi:Na+-transporting NADH:ubiquinone oxidoreductase subunit D [Porphyromonas crevioricanis]|uniref:Ion-translocating oxidoreductase complex subunit D n=2 Tax=Porphyromonas crevioricanis TaxID=393921 RepID=A0A0A2FYZ5_9PORP|nr:RnfABCDGE type electron transport complex subunit D [Porphyromonas crevioricanis]KGN90339.1 Na+-transporting NADH:ubiquinone oxidoreductase subunit D [Porphyromonas crevioricanis]KGN95320.1 Na+-transporting NADH:ubiquinone oxidoreductase subunit D [Porphyromonas crevioricanis]SJZ60318.1 electron transport complex protein RnfD [Porphyromonas crevioricanis]SQH72784.1 Na(+)-translocating NADH-quinone reductase subunit B [Porphyromonas crevioricanis]GAD05660.1 electron transport complex protein
MENKLFISPSPHIHGGDSIGKNMYGVLIALIPAFLVSVYLFGWHSLLITAVSVVACCIVEYVITKYLMGRRPTIFDGSAILTGVLLAFNVPSNLPIWILLLGALVAMGLGKLSFGGIGGNIFNPALVGRVFLLISFPVQMTTWPVPQPLFGAAMADATTGATPLGIAKGVIAGAPGMSADMLPSTLDTLIGLHGGSLGEMAAIALILGGAYMLMRRIITWHIPVSILATAFIFGGIMWLVDPAIYPTPWFHVLTGGMLLGAIFMATDYVTSPMSKKGQILYGCLIGFLTVAIRLFGAYPEGMSFAILIMNGFTPLINTYMKPKRFGGNKK